MKDHYKFLHIAALLLLGCAIFCNHAAFAAQASTVHAFHFSNGLQLFVKEDHRAPAVVSQVWYKVGSSYEPAGITGISHALEHMMFRGTKKIGPGQFSKIIAAKGGVQNAFTADDFTAYYQKLPANALATSFKLEADRMRGLLLDEKAFKKEIQVVMEERRMRTEDNPQALTYERFAAAAYIATPYHHPTVGWMHDLRQMTVGDLRQWYKKWYAPNNAFIVVVGDVNPVKVYDLAKHYFGPLKPQTLPTLKQSQMLEPLGQRTIVVKRPAKLPFLLMGYNIPSLKTAKISWEPYALTVASFLLSSGESARLPKELVRDQQVAISIQANYDLYSRLSGLFSLQATPAKGYTVFALQHAIEAQLDRLKKQPVSEQELNRVKQQVIAATIFKKDSMIGKANELGSLEAVGLSWRDADALVTRIKAVTAEQVQAVAQKYFRKRRLTVARLDPQPLAAGNRANSRQMNRGKQHVR